MAVSGETVTIACKLPGGGIHLDLRDNGGQLRRVTLRGSGESRRKDTNFEVAGDIGNRVIGDYGITRGVSKDFWDEWEKLYRAAGFEPLVRGLIFAMPTLDGAVGKSDDQREVANGFEPLDPNKKKTIGKSQVEKLETTE